MQGSQQKDPQIHPPHQTGPGASAGEAAGTLVSGSPALWLKHAAVPGERSTVSPQPRPPPRTPPLVSPAPETAGDDLCVFDLELEDLAADPQKRRDIIEEAFAAQGLSLAGDEYSSSSSTHESLQRKTNELASSLRTGPSAGPPSLPASWHSGNLYGMADSDLDHNSSNSERAGCIRQPYPVPPEQPRLNVGTGRFARARASPTDDGEDDF